MVQPVKKGVKQAYKRKTHTVNKSVPINTDRVGDRIDTKVKKKRVYQQKPQKKHPEYGTSKLEERFAKNFLDKLGVKYIYQFKMESIGRYLDFYIPEYRLAIEVDGTQFHRKESLQGHRDSLKDSVLEAVGLRLLRLSTNGSCEKEKIADALIS